MIPLIRSSRLSNTSTPIDRPQAIDTMLITHSQDKLSKFISIFDDVAMAR
ncbi:MAG: hypothetical protein QXE01_11045 [Sulfolobales archaeon]